MPLTPDPYESDENAPDAGQGIEGNSNEPTSRKETL